jgi:uncharacterized protein YbbK (DUF523 family)
MKIMVSSCLLGDNVKYDGTNNKNDDLIKFLEDYEIIKVCPEVFGGLSIPRIPSEIRNNKVINKEFKDVTNEFILGANKALKIAKENDIKVAILKDGSPSCGSINIYDGTFTHTKINGDGITAKLLKENNITVLNENNYKDYFNGGNYNENRIK